MINSMNQNLRARVTANARATSGNRLVACRADNINTFDIWGARASIA
jgi:hypothetical protein